MSTLWNKRVKYTKQGARYGWTGTITDIEPNRAVPGGATVTVTYDNGTIQPYSRSAVTEEPVGTQFCEGYLHVIGEADPTASLGEPTHIVQGRQGGPQTFAFSESEAHEVAKRKAQRSKSGQAYMVLKIASEYVRDEPPVIRKDF